jgi:hypothetical protein
MPIQKRLLNSVDDKISAYELMQTKSVVNNSNPNLVYLDVLCSNIQSNTTAPPVLQYQETKSAVFLHRAGDYEMTILKFQLSSRTLPLITPVIEPSSTNPNETIYKLTLTYTYSGTTYSSTQTVIYQPQISSIPVPSKVANQQQDNSLTYYNVYSYQWWLSLINTTFETALTDLNTQVTTAGGTLPNTNAPIITFDSQTRLCTLNAPLAGYDDTLANPISIYFNLPLYNLFAFPFTSVNYNSNVLTAKINTNSFQGSSVIYFPPSNPTYQVLQLVEEYCNLSAWCPIQEVVVTTSSFPIIAENLPTPTIYNNGSYFSSNNSNQNQDLVITGFTSDTGTYESSFLYVPTSEYRMISMQDTTQDLRDIYLSVKYLDRWGSYIPVRLNSGGSMNLKVLFRKKGYI